MSCLPSNFHSSTTCSAPHAITDLLARHINKCHANEKPLPTTTPSGRRKGSAATSRATTSKQACDQCVQSSLPCDGSNPCSKCTSRKCRCTYVKFHRQTAPSGPGHQPPRSPSSSSLSGTVGSSRLPHPDDFVLGPPPSVPHVGSFPGSDQVFNTPFTFNPAAPAYAPNWTAADMSQLPFSMASDADMAAKYRAQAEFLRRVDPSILSNSSSAMLPPMYTTQQQPPPSNNWYPAWGESGAYPPLDDTKPFGGIARAPSLASSEPPLFAPEFYGAGLIGSAYRPRRASLDFSDSSSATSQSVPSSATSSNVHLPLTGSEMYDGRSEEMQRQTHNAHILQHQRRSSIPTSQPPSFSGSSEPSQPPPQQQPHHVGEGGFSSAFGLMSIDDPNVLAGLSSDGVPFFSHLGMGVLPHSPNATPMPTRVQHPHLHQGRDRGVSLSALPTPRLTKDAADTRELKDVWKTYMRSPLSGPVSAALDLSTPQPLSLAQMPQSPLGQRRRVRVSSLPSVTPTMEKGHPLMVNGHGEAGAARATVHGNPEDLRSYEAAVNARNARNASLKLNLVPRRRGTRPSLTGSPPMEDMGIVGASSSPVTDGGRADHQGISRPSSSSSTSSLAQAFTVPTSHPPHPHHHYLSHAHAPVSGVVKPPPMQGASISLPIPPSMSMSGLHSSSHSHSHGHSHSHSHGHSHSHSHSHSVTFGSSTSLPFEPGSRASSVTSDGTGTGTGGSGSGSDGEVFRPSFKRHPSQTLVPTSSKRALVERGGGGPKGVKVGKRGMKGKYRDEGGDEMEEREGMEGFERAGVSGDVSMGSSGSRPIAGLPERAKRG
ncbi:hypothetical protein J3R83DRAFT_12553 [Lanmaoa asiatica]|nr:hypothetical protein J3R83DRAFT_12553 [Lanmaoa asiatica]